MVLTATTVPLIVGYNKPVVGEDGVKTFELLNSASIIPMTGRVRKMMGKPTIRNNPGSIVDLILKECIEDIGGHKAEPIINKLYTADRDWLVLQIRKISSGNTVTGEMKCGSCSADLEVDFDIDEVEVFDLESLDVEATVDQEYGYHTFRLENEALGVSAKFRWPTGEDQDKVAGIMRQNPIDANYRLLMMCMLEYNGDTDLGRMFLDTLPVMTLDWINTEYQKNTPGPDMGQDTDCPACGHINRVSLENSDFLFPREAKRGRSRRMQ